MHTRTYNNEVIICEFQILLYTLIQIRMSDIVLCKARGTNILGRGVEKNRKVKKANKFCLKCKLSPKVG